VFAFHTGNRKIPKIAGKPFQRGTAHALRGRRETHESAGCQIPLDGCVEASDLGPVRPYRNAIRVGQGRGIGGHELFGPVCAWQRDFLEPLTAEIVTLVAVPITVRVDKPQ
jgi:hypothetical protein